MKILNKDVYTGQRFGKWVVVRRTKHPFLTGKFYRTRCECGTVRKYTPIRNLLTGKSRSCGGVGCRVRRTKAQLTAAGVL